MPNLAYIIAYLFPSARLLIDYRVSDNGSGPFISFWNVATLGPQPSQATLDATAIDPAFITWLESHGGNATLTLRRKAKDALDAVRDNEVFIRAVAAVAADDINTIRQWLTDFKAQTALATSLANLQTRVAALPNMPQRTLPQIRTAIANKIDSGGVDT